MKIKLALISADVFYLSRIENALKSQYADKFDLICFSDYELATQKLGKEVKADLAVADEAFDYSFAFKREGCIKAYFSDSNDVDSFNELPCIGKYQRLDSFVRQVLKLYAEQSDSNLVFRTSLDSGCKTVAFVSAAGGVGTSTAAAAFAKRKQKDGYASFYLNFEPFGTSDIFFSGQGESNFSNIIFALKSNKANLALKIESEVNKSHEGVSFFGDCKIALDRTTFSYEEQKKLIDAIKSTGKYVYIVADTAFSLSENYLNLLNSFSVIVFVSDGSDIANAKTAQAVSALDILESQQDNLRILDKSVLLCNKCDGRAVERIENIPLSVIGSVERIRGLRSVELSARMCEKEAFGKI